MSKKANGNSMAGLAARRKKVVAEFKRHFQTEPVPSPTLREKLIKNIIYYAGDELEDRDSIVELAIQSEEELIDRLIHILDYYYDQYQEFS